MFTKNQFIYLTLAAMVCTALLAGAAPGQDVVTAETIRADLRRSGEFTEQEIERLEKGEIVVKELTRSVKREVALIGAVRIPFSFEMALKGFRRTVDSQKRNTSRQSGAFSLPVQADDLKDLAFGEGELADLRECRIGDCEWNLSAEIIEALRRDVDWESSDANSSAQNLLKKTLTEYVRRYSENGDPSLMVYRDTDLVVPLGDEYKDLMAKLYWIDERYPAFALYVRGYPSGKPEGAENDITWSAVKVGLKPVVMFTHSMSLRTGVGDAGSMYSVSKQIFANHYFDSSLGVAVLSGIPEGRRDSETYLVFVNRSRASALRGKLAGLLRGSIENQAKSKLSSFLKDTKHYAALASANADAELERKASTEAATTIPALGSIFYVAVPVIAILIGVFMFLLMRKRAG